MAVPAFRAERVLALHFGGETASAAAELADLARDGFRQVTRDGGYLYTLARLAQAAIALQQRDTARSLYNLLRRYAGFYAVNAMSLGIGPVAYYLGLLARYLGGTADAIAHFEQALVLTSRMGDRVHGEQARRALLETPGGRAVAG